MSIGLPSIPPKTLLVPRHGSLQQNQRSHYLRDPTGANGDIKSPIPPDGHLLTGKQEHYLKRELISREVHDEIQELNTPTALQRFGAPFRSPYGEVSPVDSELPVLRYIFVNHVRNFPFP